MKKITTLLLLAFSFLLLSAQDQLTGTIIGTEGSWGDDPTCTRDAAFDDNTSTYRWATTVYVQIHDSLSAAEAKLLYESNADTENLKGIFGDLLSNNPNRFGGNTDDAVTFLVNIADQHYTAMLRFCLDDNKKRTFTVERFCFRGSIDEWICLAGPDDFRGIVEKYLKILGTDEFFDSPYL